MASFNQIVLLIGDIEDRQRGATCHSPFPVTCLIWENVVTLLRRCAILSASAAISQPAHPSYYNALYIPPTNASHISSAQGQKTSITIFSKTYEVNERQFIWVFVAEQPFGICCTHYFIGWLSSVAKMYSNINNFFFFFLNRYSFKSTAKARQMARQPGSWHLDMPANVTFQYKKKKKKKNYP